MNNWLLAEVCCIEEPTVNEFLRFDSIVLGSSNDKGLFQTRCEAVWHCLKARKFRSVLHNLDNTSNEVHFIKQCLSENEWAECNGECSYNQESGGLKCPIPTKSFQGDAMVVIHVYDQMVPILQFEVTVEKPTAYKDVKNSAYYLFGTCAMLKAHMQLK